MKVAVTFHDGPKEEAWVVEIEEIEKHWRIAEDNGCSWRPNGWVSKTINKLKSGETFIGHRARYEPIKN